ncbi:MAG: redoxin domain-containing protein [Proteobacteria bacterium]|nr:redoxin domain-containing protein [Pseudomonadota bacterium]
MTVLKEKTAPDFKVTLADGRPATLMDYAGSPLVLIFIRHLA